MAKNKKKLIETYSTRDIAAMLDVDSRTVARWIDGNKLKAFITPGGHRKVKADDVLAFLQSHKMPIPEDLKPSNKIKILVVEDDVAVLSAMKRLLDKENKYAVVTAVDGFEAGEKFNEHDPELIILDIMLPGINGFKVCENIRAKNSSAKILAVSAYPSEENIEKIIAAGATDFLAKPFELKDLRLKLDKLLLEKP